MSPLSPASPFSPCKYSLTVHSVRGDCVNPGVTAVAIKYQSDKAAASVYQSVTVPSFCVSLKEPLTALEPPSISGAKGLLVRVTLALLFNASFVNPS